MRPRHRNAKINSHSNNEHREKSKASSRTVVNYSRSENKEGCGSLLIVG